MDVCVRYNPIYADLTGCHRCSFEYISECFFLCTSFVKYGAQAVTNPSGLALCSTQTRSTVNISSGPNLCDSLSTDVHVAYTILLEHSRRELAHVSDKSFLNKRGLDAASVDSCRWFVSVPVENWDKADYSALDRFSESFDWRPQNFLFRSMVATEG